MGTSSDGIICFGFSFEEDEKEKLPWQSEKYGGDQEKWYLEEVLGYQKPFELFDESGEWLPEYAANEELGKQKFSEYWEEKEELIKLHPMPIKVVRHCSYNYSMYIIAVPGTTASANRGYPEALNLMEMQKAAREGLSDAMGFCQKWDVDIDGKTPSWWLASLYG